MMCDVARHVCEQETSPSTSKLRVATYGGLMRLVRFVKARIHIPRRQLAAIMRQSPLPDELNDPDHLTVNVSNTAARDCGPTLQLDDSGGNLPIIHVADEHAVCLGTE